MCQYSLQLIKKPYTFCYLTDFIVTMFVAWQFVIKQKTKELQYILHNRLRNGICYTDAIYNLEIYIIIFYKFQYF